MNLHTIVSLLSALSFSASVAISQETPSETSMQSSGIGDEFAISQPKAGEKEQPNLAAPAVDVEGDTPVVLENMDMKPEETGKRPWAPPQYQSQTGVLGYDSTTFEVPTELKPQVDFWVSIYTQYNTDQGLLHDSRYINIKYADIDFTKIGGYANMTSGQRQKARENLVKSTKKEIAERLKKLQSVTSAEGLEGEDLRYWKMFESVTESNKFSEAATKGRLRFQLGQRDRFIQGIFYSGRYLKKMEEIFKEAGLPLELTRLPFVESSFNLKARSKVGASGIWQFMRYTGRLYMKVNSLVDERNDPIIATHAAARLLKFNHKLLNSWPLAVTAYNFGPTGMKKEKDKLKTDNLAEIIQKSTNRRLGFASGNFYASFLAAVEVERNAKKYFGDTSWSNELEFDEYVTDRPVRFSVLGDHFLKDEERALLYNPHLSVSIRRHHVSIPKGTKLRLPLKTTEAFVASLEKPQNRKSASSSKEEVALKTGLTKYRVTQGDTLSSIAKEFGVRVVDIKELNGINNPRNLRSGDYLDIPVVGQ